MIGFFNDLALNRWQAITKIDYDTVHAVHLEIWGYINRWQAITKTDYDTVHAVHLEIWGYFIQSFVSSV